MCLIVSLCVVLLLTICYPIDVTSDGVSRLITKSTKHAKCANKKCCEFREEIQYRKNNKINCKLLSINNCVLHDDICIWDCQQTKGNGKEKRLGKGKSTFVKFDEGNGYPNDSEESQSENEQSRQKPKTIKEMQEMSSFLSYNNECGDVYRTDISKETAIAWLLEQDQKGSRSTTSGEPDNDINGDDIERNGRRRLGQVQAYATQFPYTTAVLIRYYKYLVTKGGGEWYKYSCSGTMIGARHVLTAARCLYDISTDQWGSYYAVLVGADSYSDTTDSSKWIPWSTAIVPTIWTNKKTRSPDFDIGVIRLERSPGVGYMGFGFDNSFTVPESFNSFGYLDNIMPLSARKPYGTLWREYCSYNHVMYNYYFSSTECETHGVGSCEYKYWTSSGKRVIYGVASGLYGNTILYPSLIHAARIDSLIFNFMCDFIEEVEQNRCG